MASQEIESKANYNRTENESDSAAETPRTPLLVKNMNAAADASDGKMSGSKRTLSEMDDNDKKPQQAVKRRKSAITISSWATHNTTSNSKHRRSENTRTDPRRQLNDENDDSNDADSQRSRSRSSKPAKAKRSRPSNKQRTALKRKEEDKRRNELSDLNNENIEFREKVRALTSRITQYEQDTKNTRDAMKKLNTELIAERQQRKASVDRANTATAALNKVQELRAEKHKVQQNLDILMRMRTHLQQQLTDLQVKHDAAIGEIKRLKEELVAQTKALSSKNKEMRCLLDDEQETAMQLRFTLEETECKYDELRTLYEKQQSMNAGAHRMNVDDQSHELELQQKVQVLLSRVDELAAENLLLEDQLNGSEADHAQRMQESSAMDLSDGDCDDETDRLRSEIDSANRRVQEIEAERALAQTHVADLGSRLDEANIALQQTSSELQQLRDSQRKFSAHVQEKSKQLHDRIASLKASNDELNKQDEDNDAKVQSLQARIDTLMTANQSLKESNDGFRRQATAMNNEHSTSALNHNDTNNNDQSRPITIAPRAGKYPLWNVCVYTAEPIHMGRRIRELEVYMRPKRWPIGLIIAEHVNLIWSPFAEKMIAEMKGSDLAKQTFMAPHRFQNASRASNNPDKNAIDSHMFSIWFERDDCARMIQFPVAKSTQTAVMASAGQSLLDHFYAVYGIKPPIMQLQVVMKERGMTGPIRTPFMSYSMLGAHWILFILNGTACLEAGKENFIPLPSNIGGICTANKNIKLSITSCTSASQSTVIIAFGFNAKCEVLDIKDTESMRRYDCLARSELLKSGMLPKQHDSMTANESSNEANNDNNDLDDVVNSNSSLRHNRKTSSKTNRKKKKTGTKK
eukprot:CAMPEP_0202713924 /NCGR_PEP_ID=MMETSP1385-20130828/61525_1 /ASSEMBLY_ACC=CAM_ASM_000861 /TAXON_ID=933848 /ORGANISM="Elphidium margaritaceum" /LENGTH=861 /DNA_ID=CAMNT_0049374471 /DNA_START=71 /DNA_END=2656 /DNA_ORIENTATION=+